MKYWRESQAELERLTGEDSREFWKRIGRTGVCEEHKNIIPREIYTDKLEIIRDKQQVLTKWQNDFKELLNPVESMKWDIVDTVNLDEENDNCLTSLLLSLEVTDVMKAINITGRLALIGVKKHLADRTASSSV